MTQENISLVQTPEFSVSKSHRGESSSNMTSMFSSFIEAILELRTTLLIEALLIVTTSKASYRSYTFNTSISPIINFTKYH